MSSNCLTEEEKIYDADYNLNHEEIFVTGTVKVLCLSMDTEWHLPERGCKPCLKFTGERGFHSIKGCSEV